MKARLIAHSGESAGRSWSIEKEADLGRGNACAVRLRHERISSRHARIYYDEKAKSYFIEDLSRNGTFVAGEPVRKPEKLLPLDVINLAGVVDLIFQHLPEDPPPAP